MTNKPQDIDRFSLADIETSVRAARQFIDARKKLRDAAQEIAVINPGSDVEVGLTLLDLEAMVVALEAKVPPARPATKGVPTPTPLAVNRAMNTLLEGAYWPSSLATQTCYWRRQDDTDGDTGSKQNLSLAFGNDGDAWVILPGFTSLRFRTFFGGGSSLRTRNALLVLAEAIRRDNESQPQSKAGQD